jgi:hypothetical protein
MKYGVALCRSFLSKSESYVNQYTDHIVGNGELVHKLCSLLKFPDIRVQNDVTWLLINLTAYSKLACEILSSLDNISLIYECLLTSEKVLTENLIWLIGNIIVDIDNVKTFLLENQLFEYFAEKLENLNIGDVTKEKIMWFLSNFFKYHKFDLCKINVCIFV